MQSILTPKQQSYIRHLVDTRQKPQPVDETLRTPGIGVWHTAESIARRESRCTKAQASNVISFLLSLPEIVVEVVVEPDLCEQALEIEWDDARDLDPDLLAEARAEMEAEGEMIAREEAEMSGWSVGFSQFIDGHGNGSGRGW